MKVDFKFNLGDVVKDKVTGFTGVVMAATAYFTKCVHYGICPKTLKGGTEISDWTYLDESRLDLVKSAHIIFNPLKTSINGESPAKKTSCNYAAPKSYVG